MWDLSPPRPWEYWDIEAWEWTEAVQFRNAYTAGVEDARSEQNGK